MKTYSAKPTEVNRKWHLLDASELPVGRLATTAATLLMGKHKPMYTAHIDCGDYVVIVNAKKLVFTGNKLQKKVYYRHTGFPGGIKEATAEEKLIKNPSSIIENAVRGMIPANKLRPGRLARLKIYSGEAHEHSAQKPEKYSAKEGK